MNEIEDYAIQTATNIAIEAHSGQRDKAGRPVSHHAIRVMERVKEDGGSVMAQIVALLHDVIEDAPQFVGEIRRRMPPGFDMYLFPLLHGLTRQLDETYAEYIKRVADSADIVRMVKRADLLDHLEGKEHLTPSMVKRYEQALAILDVGHSEEDA